MDYAALALSADRLLRSLGVSMKVSRAGSVVGSGYGLFTQKAAKDETASPTSVLAQTTTVDRELLLSGLAQAPQVGDTVTADKESWTVREVDTVRPTTVTLLYKLRVG